jgi:hypothetical protein
MPDIHTKKAKKVVKARKRVAPKPLVGKGKAAIPSEDVGLAAQRQKAQKKAFLERLAANYGIITISSKEVGISNRTIERWRKVDTEFNEACIDELKHQRGLVEGKLLQKINEGDTSAIRFYLRCKGRNAEHVPETWVESVMVQGDPDQPIHARVELDAEIRSSIDDNALTLALSKAMAATPELFNNVGGRVKR